MGSGRYRGPFGLLHTALNEELTATGELVRVGILVAPDAAKVVRSDGQGVPLVTDGPLAETKEVLAGYEMSRSNPSSAPLR